MHSLHDIVIILLSAIVIIIICSKLNIPSVVGFLLTGMIIGPYAIGLIKNTQDIEVFAEVGVVLMMFIIGIEFSIKKLHRIKKIILVGGGGQVIITTAIVVGAASLYGYEINSAVFFGFLVSLSSTAIVLKLLQDRRQLDSPQGKIELGILLFQDLSVVPMVVLIPILGLKGGGDIAGSLVKIGTAFIIINVVMFSARFLMPHILNIIVKTRLKEIFILASLLACLGMAFLTNYLGLSFALGAFIAGLIISESKYSHQVVADILPFKESFNSLFFISIGMLLDFNYVVQNIPLVLSLGIGIFLLKALVVFSLVLFLKYPMRIAIIAGMGLAQVGEFSFILVKLGLSYELISSNIFQAFLASSIFTMIFTPFAFRLSPKAAHRIEKGKIFRPLKKLVADQNKKITAGSEQDEKTELEDHVIIVGYGLNGRNLAKVLKNRNIQYAIIELNPDSVKEAAGKNETVVYGDATKAKILEEAGIRKAKVITFAISDALVIDHAVANARYLNDKVYIIARTKYVFDIDRLYELGADTVFAEEYETSIEILANVMLKYGFSKSAINKEINGLHEQRYAVIRDRHGEEKLEDKILRALHDEINIESYKINTKCAAEGRTIGELDLRARSGATIISIIRDKEQISNPPADLKLTVADIVVLMGTPEQAEKAIELLN